MIPERLKAFRQTCPIIEQVEEWQPLRKWSLSEVYRVSLNSGENRIVKWGGNEMAREGRICVDLLRPLQIRTPRIYNYAEKERSALLVMEDVGEFNVEQQPEALHYLNAAKELARLRITAAEHLRSGCITNDLAKIYTVSEQHFLDQLNDLIQKEECTALHLAQRIMPEKLKKMYRDFPLTLVHHDFHAKNLVIQEDKILPVDWSNAYLSPHLGDLYCLIHEAQHWCGLDEEAIIHAYCREIEASVNHHLNALKLNDSEWRQTVKLGGICWLIRTLHWLIYGGSKFIPGSDRWIPGLLADMHHLLLTIND